MPSHSLPKARASALLVSACLTFGLSQTACRLSPGGTLIGPSVGEQPWSEVTSPHFTVRTDVSAAEAREVAVEMERTYRILADVGFPSDRDPDLRTHAVVFRTRDEYKLFGAPGTDGFFRPASGLAILSQPTFMTYGGLARRARQIFVHELTHRFVHHVCPQAPTWLNEGLADYFETVAVEDGKVILGRSGTLVKRGADWDTGPSAVPIAVLPGFDELSSMDATAFYANRAAPEEGDEAKAALRKTTANYVGSWAFVHVMQNDSPEARERLQRWLARMAAGEPARSSYEEVFADMGGAKLDAQRAAMLEELIAGHAVTVLRTSYEPKVDPASVSVRALSPAEDDLWKARLGLMRPGKIPTRLDEARALVDAALRKDPDFTEARLWSADIYGAMGIPQAVEDEMLEAVKRAPGDERAAYALFFTYSRDRKSNTPLAERQKRADQLLSEWAPKAKLSTTLNGYAWEMALAGRAADAIPLARRSVELNPSCAGCYDTLAFALFRAGAFKDAVTAQEIAVGLLHEESGSPELSAALEAYKAAWASIVLWKKRPDPNAAPDQLPDAVTRSIAKVQLRHLEQRCLRDGRVRIPKLSGSVVVRAVIAPDGTTTAESVPPDQWGSLAVKPSGAPLPDAETARCVVAQIAAQRHPASQGRMGFVFPFTFGQ